MAEHIITVLWGSSGNPWQDLQEYRFGTRVELDAFLLGADESNGWMNYDTREGVVSPDDFEDTAEWVDDCRIVARAD